MEERVKKVLSLQSRLNILNGDILELLVSGHGEEYANMDMIKFRPGTVRKLNELIAQRRLVIDMMTEEDAGN